MNGLETERTARRVATRDRLDAEFRVLVVSPSGNGGISHYTAGMVERLSCRVDVHDTRPPGSGSGVRWFVAAVVTGLVAMVRFTLRERPDVLHVHTSHRYSFYRASVYTLFAHYVWRTPVVLHVHGSSFDEFVTGASPLVAAIQRLVFDASDQVIVLSEYWREILAARVDDEKLRVVPNAVDPADYDVGDDGVYGVGRGDDRRYDDGTGDDGDGGGGDGAVPRVVFVSNLIERKGVTEFLAAIDSLLATQGGTFEVSIAGAGPLSDDVAAFAADHEEVTYHGYVSEERKRSLLAEGSIFVLPTYAEGLPIAILEAMAAGNAVVSTPVAAIPDVVGQTGGVLVPPGDVPALREALAELVADPARRQSMGVRNRRVIETRYAWETAMDSIRDVYRTVTSPPRA